MRFLLLLAGLLCLGLGSAAVCAAETVPPGNSAATQYTETFPTSQGNQASGTGGRHPSPSRVLGAPQAHRLRALGARGQAAAALAAATAPPRAQPSGRRVATGRGSEDRVVAEGRAVPTQRLRLSDPGSSSGLGAAVGQATGISAGGAAGLLLPTVLLAVLVWATAFARRRRQARPAS